MGHGGSVIEREVLVRNIASPLRYFGNLVYPILPVSSGVTLKAVGPFYLVYLRHEAICPTGSKCVTTVVDSTTLREGDL